MLLSLLINHEQELRSSTLTAFGATCRAVKYLKTLGPE